jgi:hypothetical protein
MLRRVSTLVSPAIPPPAAHKGRYCSDLTLALMAFALSHRERAKVRGLLRWRAPTLTRTLFPRERGGKTSPSQLSLREREG